MGSLLAALGLAAIKGEIRAAMRRVTQKLVLALALFMLLLLAFGFALAALTVWLADEIGTLEALLAVAAGFLIIALIVWGVSALSRGGRRRSQPPPPPPPPLRAAAADGDASALGSVAGSMAVVAIVGFVLARQLFKR